MTCADFISPLIINAAKVLDGQPLEKAEAMALAQEISGPQILDLVSLANKVRRKFATSSIHACSIINAKSGLCSQNCRFCAQSASHSCNIQTFPLLEPEKVLENAQQVYATGVRYYGYVTSGWGYETPNAEFMTILETFDLIHRHLPDMYLCASLGILSEETAAMLAQHHVRRYNMNLQTSPARYHELIATTHTIQEKIQTIRYLQGHGMDICCGGIIGLGESWEDRIDMAYAIKELKVEGAPLNVLLPIPGTPLENQSSISPAEALKCFAIFRLINPAIMLKFAAGRETTMKDFQALMLLAGLDGLMTGGYLTTRGRSVDEDMQLLQQLKEL